MAVASDGVGETGETGETEDVGVGLAGAAVGDDGRAVGEAGDRVVFSPPQATATITTEARKITHQPTTNGFRATAILG